MKKICYTVITGDCDDLKEPIKTTPGWTYLCLTDNPNLTSKTWDIKLIGGEEPKKLSRFFKCKNHFPEYDLSVFIDATFSIKRTIDLFALNKRDGIWLNSHPQRQCVYEEAQIVIDKGLDNIDTVTKQVERYRAEGLPEQYGLWRCGIIVRNPKDPKITEMCDLWWKEVEQGSHRDQISFPYACWKTGVQPNSILHGITQIYLKQSLHKPHPTDEWKFVGEGEYDPALTERYQGAHLIILKNGLLFPKWVNLYISLKHGRERFIELIKILGGVIVNG